ncbi:SurA N-terminal domain-containing protein [Pseudactinotalea sp. Z1739]|uniref:SurA N-terminal domain-containing protein n=1 Tax=Pseudactinotalea sp. Z1739 TaxID=3413028 RepID=UPI003C7E716E
MTRKLLATAATAAALIALAACSESAPQDPGPEDAEAPGVEEQDGMPEMPEMPEPDVADVPDVVATVNGTDIAGDEFVTLYQMQFQQMAMESQASGQEVDQDELKSQTLNSMVDSELLVQDAHERGYEASEEDVEALLEQTATSNQMESVEELLGVYAEQGVTEEQVRDDAQTQLLVQELVENDIEVDEPTDEEVVELYESMGLGEDEENGYELEEIRPELEAQVRNQNRSEAVGAHVDDLRSDAEVQTYL